jgi:hypothetical protein
MKKYFNKNTFIFGLFGLLVFGLGFAVSYVVVNWSPNSQPEVLGVKETNTSNESTTSNAVEERDIPILD